MKTTIVNVHIPKTAGSTLRHQLNLALPKLPDRSQTVGVDGGANDRGGYYAELRAKAREVLAALHDADLQLVSGHYRYRDIADLIEPIRDRIVLATTIRDPIERTLSDYFYSISDVHRGHETFRQLYPDLDTYLAAPIQMNKQLDYLRPFENADVDETLASVRDVFDFIGRTEQFNADLRDFTRMLGLRCPEPHWRNVGSNKPLIDEARKTHADAMREVLADDIALYEGLLQLLSEGGDYKPFDMVGQSPGRNRKQEAEGTMKTDDELLAEVEAMAPWHHRIELREGLTTGGGQQEDPTGRLVSLTHPANVFAKYAAALFPEGMQGKSFLDCGCNAGGYCFAAKDNGADRTFGFDVRQHWIDQANFVAANRSQNSDGMRFAVSDLSDLAGMGEEFDVTWFSGLFYHLPDPVAGLKAAANCTRELIFVNTAVKPSEPGEVEIPALHMKLEGTDAFMSGVHRMSWLPSGSETMKKLLNWMGFPETRLVFWKRRVTADGKPANGRLMIVGAREPGRLDGLEEAKPVDMATLKYR